MSIFDDLAKEAINFTFRRDDDLEGFGVCNYSITVDEEKVVCLPQYKTALIRLTELVCKYYPDSAFAKKHRKAESRKVEVELTKGDDGIWMHVKCGSKIASINLPLHFNDTGVISSTVRAWAEAQFTDLPDGP